MGRFPDSARHGNIDRIRLIGLPFDALMEKANS